MAASAAPTMAPAPPLTTVKAPTARNPAPGCRARPGGAQGGQHGEAADERTLGIPERLRAEMVGAKRRRVVGEDLRRTPDRGVGFSTAQAQLATGEAGGQQVIDRGLQILLAGEYADGFANWGLETDG